MTTGLLFRIWISPARLALSGRLRQVAADEIERLSRVGRRPSVVDS